MDNLTRNLREDAERIRPEISPAMEARLRASLERAAVADQPAREPRRPVFRLGWASSLTGVTAAVVLIVVVNLVQQESQKPVNLSVADVVEPLEMPLLKARKAVMTTPLRQELDNLESDLRKAENALREDIGMARRDE